MAWTDSDRGLSRLVTAALTPDLLKPEYRDGNVGNPTFGHCYVAAEALFYLLGETDYRPCRARDDAGIVHWWLQNAQGNVLDPTAAQYRSSSPPYDRGRFGGFLTRRPSKRALVIMKKVTNEVNTRSFRVFCYGHRR